MINLNKILFLISLSSIVVFSAENKTIESQPQILFEHENLSLYCNSLKS